MLDARPPEVAPDVRRCRPDQAERALSTVVDAFRVDPVLRWVWPSDERYDACAPSFFGLLLELRLVGGEVWVADDGRSVAMWDPPGGLYLADRIWPDSRWETVQSAYTPVERERWTTFDKALRVPAVAPPYWYLGVLATRPPLQGTGLGRSVLAPILDAADRTNQATYLETAGDANLRFYGKLGFAAVREATMPDGPVCFLLRRDPRSS